MNKTGKIVIGALAGFVVIGGVIVAITQMKKNKSGSQGGNGSGSGSSLSGTSVNISYVMNHNRAEKPTSLGVEGDSRVDFNTDAVGKDIEVSGTGTDLDGTTQFIVGVWKDANGKLGAYYVGDEISQSGTTRCDNSGKITFK